MLAFTVGVVGGIYGIGGGSVIGPILVGTGLTVASVAPAALFSTWVTSLVGVATYALISLNATGPVSPDWSLGIATGLGGLAGGWLGASLQPRIPERILRSGLGFVALGLAALYVGAAARLIPGSGTWCRRRFGPCLGFLVGREVDVDYLVVGAGAMGMAFTDALIDHADVRVALVDRRHGVGGHWLEAYPFVRLHQSSTFYGVASTRARWRRIQEHGPEAGLHERADQRDDLRLLRRRARRPDARVRAGSSSSPAATTSATAPSSRACPVERFEVPGALPGRRRALPRPGHPGRDAAAVRRRTARA